MYIKGCIFDISHYMIEDGPGIRTNVFFKGCPLRCKWCSNAFGLERKLQLAYTKAKCTKCGACINVCSFEAVKIGDDGYPKQDFAKCQNCMECTFACKSKARFQVGKTVTSREVLEEIKTDRIFYRRGNGGVTLSGGEILMQAEFAKEILKLCVNEGINTAIETSAFGKWEDLSQMICLSDTVFIDCKCVNSKKHRKLTGVDNGVILENIKKAATLCDEKNIRLIVRFPCIPSMNDTNEDINDIADFAASLDGNPLLNILPYHNFGTSKYEFIGKKCETEKLELLSKEKIEEIQSVMKKKNVCYSIGGYNI